MIKLVLKTAIILVMFFFTTACERTDYDLLDPDDAGKWTLFNTSTGLPGNQVRGIKGDSKGNIWFAVSSHGAAKLSKGVWTYYNTSNSYILSNGVTCIEEDNAGNIYFGTSNGFSKLSSTNNWTYFRDPSVTVYVNSIKADSDGNIWFGTRGQGFLVLTGSGLVQYYYSSFSNVNDIEEDAGGNIWIGTDNGLLKWDGSAYSIFTSLNGLPDDIVTSLFCDSKNRLWVGTYYGKTASYIDNKGTHQLSLFNGNAASEINDISEDQQGNIWFATYESGLIKYDGVLCNAFKKYNNFYEDDIVSIGGDGEGNMWFGLYSKGLVKYTLPIY